MKSEIDGLRNEMKSEIDGLRTEMKSEFSEVKSTIDRIEKRQNAIFEQTAGLSEFRAEVVTSLKDLKQSQKSICAVLGEHEIQIRNLQMSHG